MITRLSIGKDGRTAWERMKGKKFKGELAEFSEAVWYRKPGMKGKTKFEPRWETGIWLGIRQESGEGSGGTSEGVIKIRSIRRKRKSGKRPRPNLRRGRSATRRNLQHAWRSAI